MCSDCGAGRPYQAVLRHSKELLPGALPLKLGPLNSHYSLALGVFGAAGPIFDDLGNTFSSMCLISLVLPRSVISWVFPTCDTPTWPDAEGCIYPEPDRF